MPDEHSLLACLVPKLTSGVEDAATDALAFILNRSELCRNALAEMMSDGKHQLVPLERASTQVTVDDGGRLDLVAAEVSADELQAEGEASELDLGAEGSAEDSEG